MSKFIVIPFCIIILCVSVVIGIYTNPNSIFSKKLPRLVVSETTSNHLLSTHQHESGIIISEVISIEKIFSTDVEWIATLSAEKIRTIIVPGDVIPARSVNSQSVRRQSYTWAFEKIADILKTADITFINLETPLLTKCPLHDSGFVFCSDVRHIDGLNFSGVDVVSLANNHAGNYGLEGIEQTTSLLHTHGIEVTGTGKIVTKEVRGVKFAFLGFNDIGTGQGIAQAQEELILKQLAESVKENSVVIVMFHWGVEYQTKPTERQRYLAHLVIDHGADLVLGNHPHWVQPLEIYNNVLISYGHGNFIFDQMWSMETRKGIVGIYYFYDHSLITVRLLPTMIYEYGQPRFVSDTSVGYELLNSLKQSSMELQENE